jgi:NAD(P)-dependent dehydrogenase (short-subunit alcohol dehydrogenase family)
MGRATATAFAEAGTAAALAETNEKAVRDVSGMLNTAGHQTIALPCNVSNEAQVAAMVERLVGELSRLDMAFNNAGVQVPPSDPANETAENFDRVNDINMRGVWTCMKHKLRQTRAQLSGAMVKRSSLGGLVGSSNRAAYHASKHGVIGMTKSAAMDYAPRGIRINAVFPRVIDSPMVSDMLKGQAEPIKETMRDQPIARLGPAEEIAAAVLWLCRPSASFVLGVASPVDGGYTAH